MKLLKIIILQIFLVVYREPFVLIAPVASLVAYLLFKMVGLACILISLPFSYFVTKRINDTPENQRDIKNLEEFVEKFKRQ